MESKIRLVLKHTESGMYLSWSPDNYPHTHKVSQARRFSKVEDITTFIQHSTYKPDNPEEYEIVEIQINYREVVNHADSESGT